MAKTQRTKDQEDDETEEKDDDAVVEEVATDLEDEETDEISLEDIPIEEFIKDPDRLSKYTDETDVEETTKYCPQCSDYTIFVNNICTGCGFNKSVKKQSSKDDEGEESSTFEIVPDDEIVGDIGYEYNEDDESYD